MKPRLRIRKTIKWVGAAVTVLLVVVWMGSVWHFALWRGTGRWSISLDGGAIDFGPSMYRVTSLGGGGGPLELLLGKLFDRAAIPHPEPTGFFYAPGRGSMFWVPRWGTAPAAGWWVRVPLWPGIPVAFVSTLWIWLTDSRASRSERGHCLKCNYDRAGIAKDAVCPECGAAAV
jgi:hypothetical protein